jgi:pyridoxine 5-phosphate synthase
MPLTEDNPSIQTGIDLEHNRDMYAERAASLKNAGLNVSYFIDPEIDAVKHAAKARADAVALNAFKYISAESIEGAEAELDRIEQIAQLASKLNLMVYCGNGLNYRNIRPVVELGIIDEFVVGYAVICRATLVGLERAVREIVDNVHHPVTRT